MNFNLIDAEWIPVRRKDGTRQIIAPWQVTSNYESNPIVAVDAPRPDFNGAMIQFFIGLVQTTMPPKDDREWRNWLVKPPSNEELKTKLAKVSHAFDFDGGGPRFMQDFDLKTGESIQIDKLLMEMPGENTIKNNTDHFLKRDTVTKMCFPCCATALFSLQTNAPAGGLGNRTSLRGGGPLTTLILGNTLWQTIWLNILDETEFLENCGNPAKNNDVDIFPWMGHTRTSEKGQETTAMDVHPVHIYWGMPRRICINFEEMIAGICEVCGCDTKSLLTSYISKNYGTNYKGVWRHPLTPHYKDKKNEIFLPRHGQPGGITYRYWLGLVQNDVERGNQPAIVVHTFWENRQFKFKDLHEILQHAPRLWAFGYDFDNMKARCWYEGQMPLIQVEEKVRSKYENLASAFIQTSEQVSNNVRRYIKEAMFKRPGDIKGDFSFIEIRFWADTETDFYVALNKLHKALVENEDTIEIKRSWLRVLAKTGVALFDSYSQSNQIEVGDPKRIAVARRNMHRFNSENNKKIRELLDLPKAQKDESSLPINSNKR